jgi:hypothetical protein
MAKYTVSHSCGHEVVHQLFGKHTDRDRKIEWLESVPCLDCKRREDEESLAAANAEAAASNAEDGLPSLTGTEKQIAWAESIRKELLERCAKGIETIEANKAKVNSDPEEYAHVIDRLNQDGFSSFDEFVSLAAAAVERLKAEEKASWWIDNRGESVDVIVKKKAKELKAEAIDTAPCAVDAIAEATIRPESPITETVAEIRIDDGSVEIRFPEKRDDFWQIVKKGLGYTWQDGRWRRRIGIHTGTALDRGAEAGNRLLRAGFVVRCFNDSARAMMIDASFVPECNRWVMAKVKGEYAGWFTISWPRPDDLYDDARRLPGSRYCKPEVVVPAEHFDEVLDFAEVNGFQLSPGARELVDRARAARDAALIARPAVPDKQQQPDSGRPNLDPSTAGAIDADLLDN